MANGQLNRYWVLAIVLLITIIITGSIVAWLKFSPGQSVEISIPVVEERQGNIYIDGAVNIPGIYPFTLGDNLEALLQAAGGTTTSANLSGLKLYVPEDEQGQEPQKVDINRADAWLLESLPGIGPTLAQRIVDYRWQNGPFRIIQEITKVDGIGTTTYEQIKGLITVGD